MKIDEAMSDTIKARVKSGKSKSVVLGVSSPVTGRTNATNPGSLNRLFETYRDFAKADSITPRSLPFEPSKRLPAIDQRFKDMGDAMGICPYELREIMEANFDGDQTLIFTLLKKFITAVKLSGAVDLSSTHKMLKSAETNYREQHKRWKRECDLVKQRNQSAADEVAKRKAEFDRVWGDILIDLVTKVDRNPDINSLGDWDRLMVMAISHTDSKCCTIIKNNASLNFKACQQMDPSVVVNLPDVAQSIREQEEEIRWQSWMNQASINELVQMLWQPDLEGDEETQDYRREQLECAIARKSGKRPIRDHLGNLNWHATFNESNEYSDFEDLDQYNLFDPMFQKETLRRQLKSIRVKSSTGKKPKA